MDVIDVPANSEALFVEVMNILQDKNHRIAYRCSHLTAYKNLMENFANCSVFISISLNSSEAFLTISVFSGDGRIISASLFIFEHYVSKWEKCEKKKSWFDRFRL